MDNQWKQRKTFKSASQNYKIFPTKDYFYKINFLTLFSFFFSITKTDKKNGANL